MKDLRIYQLTHEGHRLVGVEGETFHIGLTADNARDLAEALTRIADWVDEDEQRYRPS